MECEPAASPEVENVACPALSAEAPRVVAPSRNVTDPVGVPELLLTVAVKVTDCPANDGFAEDATTVVVAALFTVCVITEEVLSAKLPSLA